MSGQWHDFWRPGQRESGGRVIEVTPGEEQIAVRVRAGAIITRQRYVQSTALSDASFLRLDVYTGADGEARLREDDGRTEKGPVRTTVLRYRDKTSTVQVMPAHGDYPAAPAVRAYEINLIGATTACFVADGNRLIAEKTSESTVRLTVPSRPVRRALTITPCSGGGPRSES